MILLFFNFAFDETISESNDATLPETFQKPGSTALSNE